MNQVPFYSDYNYSPDLFSSSLKLDHALDEGAFRLLLNDFPSLCLKQQQSLLEKLKKFNPLQLQCMHAFKGAAFEGDRTQDLIWVIPVCQGIRVPEANRLWSVFTSDYSVEHIQKAMHLSSRLAVDVFLRAVDTNIHFFSRAAPERIELLERVKHPTLEKLIYFLTEYHPEYSAADPLFGNLLKLNEAEAEGFIYWMVSMPELGLRSWLLACKKGRRAG